MPYSFDGYKVPERLSKQPCGGTPVWDYGTAAGYRCDSCMAMLGSIAQPQSCVDLNTVVRTMGFKNDTED